MGEAQAFALTGDRVEPHHASLEGQAVLVGDMGEPSGHVHVIAVDVDLLHIGRVVGPFATHRGAERLDDLAGLRVESDEALAGHAVDRLELATDQDHALVGDRDVVDDAVEFRPPGRDPVAGVAVERGDERLVVDWVVRVPELVAADAGEDAADEHSIAVLLEVPDLGLGPGPVAHAAVVFIGVGVGALADDAPAGELRLGLQQGRIEGLGVRGRGGAVRADVHDRRGRQRHHTEAHPDSTHRNLRAWYSPRDFSR